MADQDFNIRVVTTADTSGIRQTSDELKKLRQESLRSALTPVPEGLGGPATPKIAPKVFPVIQDVPEDEATKFGDKFAGRISHGLTRTIAHFLGIGAILEFVHSLKSASEEIAKVAESLDKQGEELVKHVQLYDQEARHAKDTGDALKISSATLKEMEDTQKTFNDLSQKEIGWAAKVSDYLQVQLLARQKIAGIGDYEAAHQVELQTAQDQMMTARQKGMQEIFDAEKAINRTTEERLAILRREITIEEQHRVTAAQNTDPGGYVKAFNNLSKLRKELEDVLKLEAQREQLRGKTEKYIEGSDPQVKAILQNEAAMFKARAEGRDRDADLYERSAQKFRASASPQQLGEVAKIYGGKEVVDAIKQLGIDQKERDRALIDLWR